MLVLPLARPLGCGSSMRLRRNETAQTEAGDGNENKQAAGWLYGRN